MVYEISDGKLKAAVDSLGAELTSLRKISPGGGIRDSAGACAADCASGPAEAFADGCEYLWQGDPAVWDGRAPNLFPFCGRLYGASYTYRGREYPMELHGFLRSSLTECVCAEPDRLVLRLRSGPATRELYPFDFLLETEYRVADGRLMCGHRLTNTGSGGDMIFSFGAHPGIAVPAPGGPERFSDYCVDFGGGCRPELALIGPDGLDLGGTEEYPLREGRYLDLTRELFAGNLFFSGCGDEVSLAERGTGRRIVTVRCPKARFWGLWQTYGNGARFLCIEPWGGFPGRSGVREDLETRLHTDRCGPGGVFVFNWEIVIG